MNRLIFLGTGNANNVERQMTSLLFVTPKRNFLIDCGDGMGTVRQIVRSGVDPQSISDVFLTHHHADHILGLTHFLYIRLRRDVHAKIRLFGPKRALMKAKTIGMLVHDAVKTYEHRIALVPLKDRETVIPGPGASVQAGSVEGPPKVPTLAYKITAGGKAVVYSADMHPSAKFDRFAKGAEILVHECSVLHADRPASAAYGHSSAREAGECARKAGVKTLFLTHLPEESQSGKTDLANEARRYFPGAVVVAEDGMSIGF